MYKEINTGDDSELEIKSTTLVEKAPLCNNNDCTGGAPTTFTVEIGYKENGYSSNTNTHLHFVTLNFDFRRVFDITYNGFTNVSSLANEYKYIMDGETKVIPLTVLGPPSAVQVVGATGTYSSPNLTLSNITVTGINDTVVVNKAYTITYVDFTGSTSGMPSSIVYTGGSIEVTSTAGYPDSVTVTGATGTYNPSTHLIPISNITGNITITATYSSGGGTTTVVDNGDGTTTTTTVSEVDNGDGSTTTTTVAVLTDENGNTISSSNTVTTESSSGSTTTTTNYDAQGNPTTGSTANTDTSGNVNTQQVVYDQNGNSSVSGYTIDTSNNSSNSETISSGLDTGMLVFDGNDWVATLVAKIDMNNVGSSGIAPVINLSERDSSDNKVDGIIIYARKAGGSVYNESVEKIAASNSSPAMRFKINRYSDGSLDNTSIDFYSKQTTAYKSQPFGTKTRPITLTFKLSCTSNIVTSEIWYNNQVVAKPRYSRTYGFTSGLANITFELGKYTATGASSQPVYLNFDVISFDVHKIQ